MVASATPSIAPTERTLTPKTVTKNAGRRPWIIAEDMAMHRLTSPRAMTLRDSVGGMSGPPAREPTESRTGISLAIPSPLITTRGPLRRCDDGDSTGRECQREIGAHGRQWIGAHLCPFCMDVAMVSSMLRMIQKASPYVDAGQSRQDDLRIPFT